MRSTVNASLVLLLTLALPALAADSRPQPPIDPTAANTVVPLAINQAEIAANVVTDPGAAPAPAHDLVDPMILDIEGVIAASRAQVAELAGRVASTTNATTIDDLQQQIAQVKQHTELDILAIQVRYARQRGHEGLAARIEADIALIQTPPLPTPPTTPRPAPGDQH